MNNRLILLFFLGLFLLSEPKIFAQEDIQFSNYKYSRLFYNPAYAGSSHFMEAIFAYRNQWTGVGGSPETALISVQAPVNNTNFGLGGVIYNNQFGIQKDNAGFISYAYHLRVSSNGILSMGMQAGFINKQIKWTQLTQFDPNYASPDPAFPDHDISTWVPNFGIGFYYYTPKYYLGLSAPRILSNDQPSAEGISDNFTFDAKTIPFYVGAGTTMPLNHEIDFAPSILFVSSYSGTSNANVNLDFIHDSGFSVGAGYRTGDFWAALVGYRFSQKLLFSYSYEKSFGKYRSKGFTNHEIILNYNLSLRKSQITSPRYF